MNTLKLTNLGSIAFTLLLSSPRASHGQHVHAVIPAVPVIDHARLLRAIAAVETGTTNLSRPCRKVGKAGERSAFQIKASVWKQYTRIPHAQASTDATLAHLIATLHLQTLKERLRSDNATPTVIRLAMLWNAGTQRHEYAGRVNAIYNNMTAKNL